MPGEISYFKSLAIAHDQLFNAICGGWPDETLSSRAWRDSLRCRRHWPRKLIDTLFFWDRDGSKHHCRLSYESEKKLKQMPPALRRIRKPQSKLEA